MPKIIPLRPDGDRTVTINTGPQVLVFRTYYVTGADSHWLLDIKDGQENTLVAGINLTPGAANLLTGLGDTLEGCQLVPVVISGSEKDPEAPGNTLHLVWLNPGEINPIVSQDPMETIGMEDDFAAIGR